MKHHHVCAALFVTAFALITTLTGCDSSDVMKEQSNSSQKGEHALTQEAKPIAALAESKIEPQKAVEEARKTGAPNSTQLSESEPDVGLVVGMATIPTNLYWPTDKGVGTSLKFGDDWVKKGCDEQWKKHTGIDIKVSKGRPVYAAESGAVKVVSSDPVWKGWMTIEHTDGKGLKYTTVYWHVTPLVKVNDRVEKGKKIATVADMGSNTHLHFGVRNAPYSNVANRGGLPRTKPCGPDDPIFPEQFKNPMDYTRP